MLRARRGDDSGFTVVELSIVLALFGVIMTSILGLLESQTRVAKQITSAADNQELVRGALVEVQRDLRSTARVDVFADRSLYATQVAVTHLDFTTGATSKLRWRLDTSGHELVREALNPSTGAVIATTYRLVGVTTATVFRYYATGDVELAVDSATSTTIARCVVRIRVTIAAAPTAGPRAVVATSDVQLRNQNRPGGPCDG